MHDVYKLLFQNWNIFSTLKQIIFFLLLFCLHWKITFLVTTSETLFRALNQTSAIYDYLCNTEIYTKNVCQIQKWSLQQKHLCFLEDSNRDQTPHESNFLTGPIFPGVLHSYKEARKSMETGEDTHLNMCNMYMRVWSINHCVYLINKIQNLSSMLFY